MEGVRVEAKESQKAPVESHQYGHHTRPHRLGMALLTIGAKHQERERVAQHPLQHPANHHEQPAHEIVHPRRRGTVPARAPPAHDIAGEGRQRHDEPQQRQRRRVPKRLAQVPLDGVLRRQVDLLEQLGRDGDGAAALDPLQRRVGRHALVQ